MNLKSTNQFLLVGAFLLALNHAGRLPLRESLGWNAGGGRPEPKFGLEPCFEPKIHVSKSPI